MTESVDDRRQRDGSSGATSDGTPRPSSGDTPRRRSSNPARQRGNLRTWWRRAGRWVSRHGPQTLVGAVVVAVVSAALPVVLERILGGGDEEKPLPPSSDGKATAVAQPCVQEGCYLLDPKEQGCDDKVRTLAQRDEPILLEIRYSPTCEAAWGRIRHGRVGDTVRISTEDGKTAVDGVEYDDDAFTRMVPAGGSFTLTACATADDGDGEPRWPRFCVTATERDLDPSPGPEGSEGSGGREESAPPSVS